MICRVPILVAVAAVLTLSTLAGAQGPGSPSHGTPPPGLQPGSGPGQMPGQGPGNPGANPSLSGGRGNPGAPRFSQQFGPAGRWWDDKSVVHSVGISRDQQKKMDAIFDANKPAIVDSYKKFLSEQSTLNKISKDPKSDQATIFAAIDAVSAARTALQKTTAQMLIEIRQQMAPDQIVKLEGLK